MPHIRPVLLAVALAGLLLGPVAATTPAIGAAGPDPASASVDAPVVDVDNSTNYLDIDQAAVERGDYGEASLDVGAALESEATGVGADLSRRSFERRYVDADNESERNARLYREIDRIERRIGEIERHQQRAIERYNTGEYTADELLRELAMVGVTARQATDRIEHVEQLAGLSLSEDLEQRMDALETRLVALRGPVRTRAVGAVTGQGPATTAYAVTSSNAVVLGTTDGRWFYRGATLPDNFAPDQPDQFVTDEDPSGITAAGDRAQELYPWAYADAATSLERAPGTSVYILTLDHSQGLLETYLDGATRSVFHERQTLRVDRVPTTTTTNETGALALRVNRTHGTGPMEVTVRDPVTNATVNATVRVNGYRVGTTGADGSLWTTTPHRQVQIVAETDDETVSVMFFSN